MAAGVRWTGRADRETPARGAGVDFTIFMRVQRDGTERGVLRALVDGCATMMAPQEVTVGWNSGGMPHQAPEGRSVTSDKRRPRTEVSLRSSS
jgi:hypothetical protein